MVKVRSIRGFEKFIFLLRVKLGVFIHFLPDFLKGKMSLRRFIAFLKRLLYFLSKLKHNKFIKIGKNTRIDLYIPGFPLPAFYTACSKFSHFDTKLPCTVALISITSACKFNCSYCYQKTLLSNRELRGRMNYALTYYEHMLIIEEGLRNHAETQKIKKNLQQT